MARPQNLRLSRFKDRVQWCLDHLDTNGSIARFIDTTDLVYERLQEAINKGQFRADYQEARGERTWRNALNNNSVPNVYINWLCSLYPDMTHEQLLAEPYESFLEIGNPIVEQRRRWDNAIELFAKRRLAVSKRAKEFYQNVDASDIDYPLLLGSKKWIRQKPLELSKSQAIRTARSPLPGIPFEPCRLEGLSGDFLSYKGTKTYRTRKLVKPEPQHNGEIFCVHKVLTDSDGFTDFEYFLSHYYDYINTSEVLGVEFADWMLANPDERFPSLFKLRGAPKDAFNLTNRATYPGINCLSMFLNYSEPGARGRKPVPPGNYFLVHRRDETQLQAQNVVHVLPAGGHQGIAAGAHAQDTPIRNTIVREFLEELFDKEELYKQVDTWGDYMEIPDIRNLVNLFFDGPGAAAQIHLFGFGLDPTTLKPEVLCGIVIDWKKVNCKMPNLRLKFNWEVRSGKLQHDRHNWVNLSKEDLLRESRGGVQSLNGNYLDVLPAGAACMRYAANHFEDLIGNRK